MNTFKGIDQYELIDRFAPGLEAYMDQWLESRISREHADVLEDAKECAYLEYEHELQYQFRCHLSDIPEEDFEQVRLQLVNFLYAIAKEQGEAGYPLFYYTLSHIKDKETFLHYFFLLFPKLWS